MRLLTRSILNIKQESRRLGVPRIYISANSGARIGLAEEVKALFRVAWEDPDEPEKVKKMLFPRMTFGKFKAGNNVLIIGLFGRFLQSSPYCRINWRKGKYLCKHEIKKLLN